MGGELINNFIQITFIRKNICYTYEYKMIFNHFETSKNLNVHFIFKNSIL